MKIYLVRGTGLANRKVNNANHPDMNTHDSSNFTLFQDRDLSRTFRPKTPARYSTEPEGEGMELCLRALLIASLIAAMAVCGVHPDRFANVHDNQPSLPDAHTSVALVQPHAAPVAKTL